VRKAILGPLAPRRPWHQVVPNYRQRQDVLRDKKVMSSCPTSRQDVTYATFIYAERQPGKL